MQYKRMPIEIEAPEGFGGRGHWFEADAKHIRIGYSWDTTEKLVKGMGNVLKAIEAARTS